MKKFATANWKGSGKDGKGLITTESESLKDAAYTYVTRFTTQKGLNPEELIAAAHAACFTMQLSFNLNRAGFTADEINTKCDITFDDEKKSITQSHLSVSAKIPVIGKEKFDEIVEDARANCPISKSLNANVTCDAKLV